MSIAADIDLAVGVDTHLDTHTVAILRFTGTGDRAGAGSYHDRRLPGAAELGRSRRSRLAADVGYRGHPALRPGPGRYLTAEGQQVSEIDSTKHAGKRRAGKSDPDRCGRAARELLARPRPAQMHADGDREVLRLLMADRDNGVQSCKTARAALASVLMTAPAQPRGQFRVLPRVRRARACAELTCPAYAGRLTTVTCQTLIRLGKRIAALAEVARELEAQIAGVVEEWRPTWSPPEAGLGVLSAALILLSWSHAGRITGEQAFAMLSGTAPVPVSSGRTDRHRLNRLGDRVMSVLV